MKAFKIPLPDVAKENSELGITNEYLTESNDGVSHVVRGIPYIMSEKLKGCQVIRNYTEYILQIVRNILYTDYTNIPYMRHLKKPLENILFDLATEDKKDEIEEILYYKFKESDITLVSVDVDFNREEKTVNLTCSIKVKGILVNTQISKGEAEKSNIYINL